MVAELPWEPRLVCPHSVGLQQESLLALLSLHSHPWLTLSPLCTHILLQLGLTTSLLWASFGSLLHPALLFLKVKSPVYPLSTFLCIFFPHHLQAQAHSVSDPGIISLSSSCDSHIQECWQVVLCVLLPGASHILSWG